MRLVAGLLEDDAAASEVEALLPTLLPLNIAVCLLVAVASVMSASDSTRLMGAAAASWLLGAEEEDEKAAAFVAVGEALTVAS